MASASVDRRIARKLQTKNGIFRRGNGDVCAANRKKMCEKLKQRIQRDREALLDKHRSLSMVDIKLIAIDVARETYYEEIDQEIQEEQNVMRMYEEWLQEEMETVLKSMEDFEDDCLCPVCCKCNFKITSNWIKCDECNVDLLYKKPLNELYKQIQACITEHNAACQNCPSFIYIPDGFQNNLVIICQICSLMSLLL